MSTVTFVDDEIDVSAYWSASQNGQGLRGAFRVAEEAVITPLRFGSFAGFPTEGPVAWSWTCSTNLSPSPTVWMTNRAKHSDSIHGFACILRSDVRRATTRRLEV